MNQYKVETQEVLILEKVFCNKCGKKILCENGYPVEDVLEVDKTWGYFSQKDNQRDQFALCEECYDAFVRSFKIPVEREVQL